MANSTPSSVITAKSFLSGLGVDTHIPYTDGDYSNINNVISHLNYLGINQVRDGITNGQNGSAPIESYITAAKAGIQFTFIIVASTTAELTAQLDLIERVQKAAPGSVVAVEGPNEINNQAFTYNGVSGLDGALNFQRALYSAVHSDPDLAGVSVVYFTGWGTVGVPTGPDPASTPGLADYNNQHPYPTFGQAPAQFMDRGYALKNTTSPNAPAFYTETGYSTNEVSANVQAKYVLDLYFDTALEGIKKTYVYQLLDAYAPNSPQGNEGFGLFDYNEAAKPVATALHNLTTILRDTGAGDIQPTMLNYSVSGLPATGSTLLIQKTDGSYIIAVWAEPELWNSTTRSEITAQTYGATVALPSTFASARVFDPMTGTTPIASYSNVNSVPISISDHPILIELSGTGTTTPPTTASDTMVLSLSQTPASGVNATFIVSVDGRQLGPPQSVTALRNSGQSQDFVFEGDFGNGPHNVSIVFTNAFAGAAADAGRVLYINAITFDGQTTFTNYTDRYRGEVKFTIDEPATPKPSNVGTQNTLKINVAEANPNGGDVMFMVSVDGQIVGGVQTVTAQKAAGQSQDITLTGNFGAGAHTVTIDYLNGFDGQASSIDRLLYVNAITLDGKTTTINESLRYTGPRTYGVEAGTGAEPPPASPPPTIALAAASLAVDSGASASDRITNDGHGTATGTLTGAAGTTVRIMDGATDLGAATLNGSGGWSFAFNLGSGTHALTAVATDPGGRTATSSPAPTITVDVTAPTVTIGAASQAAGTTTVSLTGTVSGEAGAGVHIFNGATDLGAASVNNGAWSFSSSLPAGGYTFRAVATDLAGNAGSATGPAFTVTAPPSPPPSNPPPSSTSDTMVLSLSQAPAFGVNATFIVSIDGKQVGGPQTVSAVRSAGQAQDFTFQGDFGDGPHNVSIAFTNGFAGAATDAGRILYINAITFDGLTTFTNYTDRYRGPVQFTINEPATPKPSNVGTQDVLKINVAEANPNGGDAMFMVSVDGQIVGGIQTVTAQKGAGQSQDIVLTGNFGGAGNHTVTVDYLNGFDGDASSVDRVLYVNSITLDGEVTAINNAMRYIGASSHQVFTDGII